MWNLLPKDRGFFDLFDEAARNVHRGATQLLELLEAYDRLAALAPGIKDTEHEGDRLTHETIGRLNQTFITPLDREDIHRLAAGLDDIVDRIDAAVARLVLYKIARPSEDAKKMARCLVKATGIIVEAMRNLRNLKNRDAILHACVDVHTCENEGDQIEQHALATLFEGHYDPIEVIKWKDIYDDLEAATDHCEDVANVLEAIVLKNA